MSTEPTISKENFDALLSVFTGVMSKTLNMDETGVRSLLFDKDGALQDTAQTALLKADETRITQLREEKDRERDAYGKEKRSEGVRTAMEGLEKQVRAKYGEDFKQQGIDLITAVVDASKVAQPTPGLPTKLTVDQIKVQPAYQELERQWTSEKETLVQTHAKELETKGQEWQAKYDRSYVMEQAEAIRREMNPILSQDPARATKQLSWFERDMDALKWNVGQPDTNGKRPIMLLDPNDSNKRLEDGHGNPVPFKDAVQGIVRGNYDLPKSPAVPTTGTPTPGAGGDPEPGGAGSALTLPNTLESRNQYGEWLDKIEREVSDPKERETLGEQLNKVAVESGVLK